MRERPFYLFIVRGVDVLFNHDHMLVAILRGAVPPKRCGNLLGLPLVVLLDLNADVDTVRNWRRVYIEDAWYAGAVQNVPSDPCPLHRGHHAVLAVGAW